MRKPSRQSTEAAPVSLGTKRQCPKCSTKFYDFNKEEIECPKCGTEIDPQSLNLFAKSETKKAPKAVKIEEEVPEVADTVAIETEGFESVEDLADDEEEVVEDLGVDGEDEKY